MSLRDPQRHDILAALAVLALVSTAAFMRRHNASESRSLDAVLVPDAGRLSGQFPNGLHYYVLANGDPGARAELRLVVAAGSAQEADDQRGLAHAVEHMVFRGTRRFPGRTVSRYLESIGMRGGQDVNATTDQDATTYRMTVPTDRAEVLDSAIAMLADMAHAATFDSTEARAEAGIVLEEWRSRRDAGRRLSEAGDSMLFAGSRYGTRQTIGDTAVLRRFDLGAMRRFYDDWYRPELMAVVLVGDVDAAEAQRALARAFGAIPARAERRERPVVSAPVVHGARAAVLTDDEATGDQLSLWFPRRFVHRVTVRDYRARVAAMMWRSILDERLGDAADEPGSPLLGASTEWRSPVQPMVATTVDAEVADDRLGPALDLVLDEMRELARTGPTPRELRVESERLQRHYRQLSQWPEYSPDAAGDFVHEFLSGDVALGRRRMTALMHELIPTITADDVRDAARLASPDSGAFVLATGPARRRAEPVSPAMLVARLRDAGGRPPRAAHVARDPGPLMPVLPAPGAVTGERLLPDVETHELTLSNGMRVLLKPTAFVDGQFEFRLVGPGGASLASDADYPSAYHADAVLRNTGVGTLSGREVDRLLASSSIDFTATVLDDAISFRGYAAPSDLETLLQLVHLHFTAPRADTVAFRRFRERTTAYNARRDADPALVFDDSVAATVNQHHRRAMRGGKAFLDAVDLDRALAFWRARTANAAGFTLVLAGDFTVAHARPLIARYLGSLPGGVAERPRDRGVRFPARTVRRTIVGGAGVRAHTRIVVSGPYDAVPGASEALAFATGVAERALDERLRELLGGTYDVDVTAETILTPPSSYRVTIDFEAAPERIDALGDAALAELARLRTSGPTDAEFTATRAARARDLDGSLRDNDYWASELSTHTRLGWPLAGITSHQRDAEHLTRQKLRAACRDFLGGATWVRVTMLPRAAR